MNDSKLDFFYRDWVADVATAIQQKFWKSTNSSAFDATDFSQHVILCLWEDRDRIKELMDRAANGELSIKRAYLIAAAHHHAVKVLKKKRIPIVQLEPSALANQCPINHLSKEDEVLRLDQLTKEQDRRATTLKFLSAKKKAVVISLLCGVSLAQTLDNLNIARSTAHRWVKKSRPK